MIKKLGLTLGLLVVGVTAAAAQSVTFRVGPPPQAPSWSQGAHPYARRNHDVCHRKAWRLREYERHAASDGRIGGRERREIESLRYDLDRTCGRYRWRG